MDTPGVAANLRSNENRWQHSYLSISRETKLVFREKFPVRNSLELEVITLGNQLIL